MEPNTDAHTALIAATLRDRFGLSPEHLGIQRVEHAKNNHVYLVDMAPPTSELREDASSRPQPFTSVIPAGTSRLVFRIANADASLEDAVRVRNEVACLALGRQALASVDARLVPRVYAWNDRLDAEGGGLRWILEEWKGGETWPSRTFASPTAAEASGASHSTTTASSPTRPARSPAAVPSPRTPTS
ncbi:hypothetical protein VTK73DRAFT_3845 [Phialemonium thermophilum]|uniref:Aminoglycoside phosphotransferase domain-containing protein n=1 Tax=Phialemonium thermophilum TaxID=223376 RepID=A0ABR3VEH7_9PEZI